MVQELGLDQCGLRFVRKSCFHLDLVLNRCFWRQASRVLHIRCSFGPLELLLVRCLDSVRMFYVVWESSFVPDWLLNTCCKRQISQHIGCCFPNSSRFLKILLVRYFNAVPVLLSRSREPFCASSGEESMLYVWIASRDSCDKFRINLRVVFFVPRRMVESDGSGLVFVSLAGSLALNCCWTHVLVEIPWILMSQAFGHCNVPTSAST